MKQFQNLFIVLNNRREVIGWRLTRTTAFEEIKDLLVAHIVALHCLWYFLWHMEKLTLYLTIFVIQREPLRGITMDFNNVLWMFITRIKAPLLSCHMFYDLHKPSPSVSEKHSSGEHTVLFILLRPARILFPFISTFSQWRLQCCKRIHPRRCIAVFRGQLVELIEAFKSKSPQRTQNTTAIFIVASF